MSTSVQPASAGAGGGGGPSGLADVIDTILDKGLVIDAYVRVSLVGIEILTIDARIVVASVDTYLRFAEAANRLDLTKSEKGLPDVIAGAKGVPAKDEAKEMIQGVVENAGELTGEQRDPAAEAAESETEVEVDRAHQGPPKRKFRPKREEG